MLTHNDSPRDHDKRDPSSVDKNDEERRKMAPVNDRKLSEVLESR